MFQSTHLHEVRHTHSRQSGRLQSFNPRTYTRCDAYRDLEEQVGAGFNPRTYTRCDRDALYIQTKTGEFQSTHLHEVRLKTSDNKIMVYSVSIHAPAQGATHDGFSYFEYDSEFQSTHLHKVRRTRRFIHRPVNRFNPRTCTRCDTAAWEENNALTVSIHAPAQGATAIFSG